MPSTAPPSSSPSSTSSSDTFNTSILSKLDCTGPHWQASRSDAPLLVVFGVEKSRRLGLVQVFQGYRLAFVPLRWSAKDYLASVGLVPQARYLGLNNEAGIKLYQGMKQAGAAMFLLEHDKANTYYNVHSNAALAKFLAHGAKGSVAAPLAQPVASSAKSPSPAASGASSSTLSKGVATTKGPTAAKPLLPSVQSAPAQPKTGLVKSSKPAATSTSPKSPTTSSSQSPAVAAVKPDLKLVPTSKQTTSEAVEPNFKEPPVADTAKPSKPPKPVTFPPNYVQGGDNWTQHPDYPVAFLFSFNKRKLSWMHHFLPGYRVVYVPKDAKIENVEKHLRKCPGAISVTWGYREPEALPPILKQLQMPLYRLEDAFVRSVGLGSHPFHVKPYSLVLDSRGLYYDAHQPSDLEHIYNTYDFANDPELLKEAQTCRAFIQQHGINKYNLPATGEADALEVYGPKSKPRILVIGQVATDASIEYGCLKPTTHVDLLRAAIEDNPDADIIYKPHPEVLATKGFLEDEIGTYGNRIKVVTAKMGIYNALQTIDKVYTITSLSGFEALLAGVPVVTLGAPFYAGWGLTDDRTPMPRRTKTLTLDALFAGAYLLYPTYADPETGDQLTLRAVLDRVLAERDQMSLERSQAIGALSLTKDKVNDDEETTEVPKVAKPPKKGKYTLEALLEAVAQPLAQPELPRITAATVDPAKVHYVVANSRAASLYKEASYGIELHYPPDSWPDLAQSHPGQLKQLMAAYLLSVQPKGVLFSGDTTLEALFSDVCDTLAIPRIAIPWTLDPTAELVEVDQVFAWNQAHADFFKAQGLIDQQIQVLGQPGSPYPAARSITRSQLQALGIVTKRPLLLLMPNDEDQLLAWLSALSPFVHRWHLVLHTATLPTAKVQAITTEFTHLPTVISPTWVAAHSVGAIMAETAYEVALTGVPTLVVQAAGNTLITAVLPNVTVAHGLTNQWLNTLVDSVETTAKPFTAEGQVFQRLIEQTSFYRLPTAKERLLYQHPVPIQSAVLANPLHGPEVTEGSQKYLMPMLNARVRLQGGIKTPEDIAELAKGQVFFQWGWKTTDRREQQAAWAKYFGKEQLWIEDGFIRSLDLGLSGEPGLAILLDDVTPYFNATQESRMQKILNSDWEPDDDVRLRAMSLIERIVSSKITKYNHAPPFIPSIGREGAPKILLIDQRFGDFSVEMGLGTEHSFEHMLKYALSHYPNHDIIVKQHPDAIKGGKSSYFSNERMEPYKLAANLFTVRDDINPYSMMQLVEEVFVVTSGMGFEALMANKQVTCFGAPFYSGRGLTKDMIDVPFRKRERDLESIFACAYLMLSRYYNPAKQARCELEELVEYLIQARGW
jgi:capsule polysaccharide export protein KpsC/LpsZ